LALPITKGHFAQLNTLWNRILCTLNKVLTSRLINSVVISSPKTCVASV